MEILGKLFGSNNRIKLLRMFLFNPGAVFTTKDLARRAKVSPATVRRELSLFKSISLVKPKVETRISGGRKVKAKGWQMIASFPFAIELRELLNKELFPDRSRLTKKFTRCGRLKLMVISGVFLQDPHRDVDLILVGDNLKRTAIDHTVRSMEADIGRELTYAVMDTKDFVYRLHSSDKFIRDLLDYPHEFLIDKIGV
jgi:hypothetical protein